MRVLVVLFLVSSSLYSEVNYLIQGKKALANRNYQEAIKYFNLEIKNNPKQCDGYFYLAQTYERLKQIKESIKYYETSAKMNCPFQIREQCFWKVYHYYKYNEDWLNLYEISKEFLKFKYNREVEKTMNLAESNIDPVKVRISQLQKQAILKENENKFSEAIKIYKEIYKISNNINYLIKVGELYKKIDEEELAIETFRNVLKEQSHHWYANYQLGLYYYNNGFPDESISYFETSLYNSKNLDDKNRYFLLVALGYVYLSLENIPKLEKTLNDLKKIKYIDSNNEILSHFLSILKNKTNKQEKENFLKKYNKEEFAIIYKLVDFLIQNQIHKAGNEFFEIDFKNKKYLRWSNYINQIFYILLFEYINDKNQLKKLINILYNVNFKIILEKPFYNFLLIHYFENRKKTDNQLDSYLLNIIKQNLDNMILFRENISDIVILYSYYKLNEFELFINFYKKYQINNDGEYHLFHPLFEYLASIIYANQNDWELSYNHLKKAIEMDSEIKEIAISEPFWLEISKDHKKFQNLLGIE